MIKKLVIDIISFQWNKRRAINTNEKIILIWGNKHNNIVRYFLSLSPLKANYCAKHEKKRNTFCN